MDHGGHQHHGGHMCSMNMLFTWSPEDLCIIFRSWHVRSTASLIWSLLAIVALTAGYELVRELGRRYESGTSLAVGRSGDRFENATAEAAAAETSSLLRLGRAQASHETPSRPSKVVLALFYAVQVFYSFFIMLLFMTYNGWVMLAVAVGAFLGFILFSNASASKSVACH